MFPQLWYELSTGHSSFRNTLVLHCGVPHGLQCWFTMSYRAYMLCHGAVPPPLFFSDFYVPFLKICFPRGAPSFAEGLGCVLWWVCWSQLCPAWCTPWPLPTAATPAAPALPTVCHGVSKILRTQFVFWVVKFCSLLLLLPTIQPFQKLVEDYKRCPK